MSAEALQGDPGLVPGRECGTCHVCCVSLTINEPGLQKPQGYRCRNLQPGQGCTIYATRPPTCREFECGWRKLKWVRESLRPDKSAVLIKLHAEISRTTGQHSMGIAVTLLDASALKAEGLAETVAAAVAADIPVYLHVPGPPGYTASQAKVNDALRHAVVTKDKAALLGILKLARAKGMAGKHVPIVMKPPAG